MAEYDSLGRDEFLRKYGYGRALRYFVRDGDARYDSKAIYGVAYGYEHPYRGPLTNDAFTGGEATVKRRLESLGNPTVLNEPAGVPPPPLARHGRGNRFYTRA